jgi:hypothetical protein
MQFLPIAERIIHTQRKPNYNLPTNNSVNTYSLFNLNNFSNSSKTKSYIPITGCIINHILQNQDLSNLEKIYYLLADSLALINFHCNKQRAIALAADSWAKKLNCSRSQIFTLQKSLAAKGYFILYKDKNSYGQNNRNLIYPTLPDNVFELLRTSPDRSGEEHLPYVDTNESKREYLDRSKLFISISYQTLKELCAHNQLTSFHKLVWLDLYTQCYKKYIVARIEKPTASFSLITSITELVQKCCCDKRHLSKALITLAALGLIKREHFYLKKEAIAQGRQDKSLWKITLLPEISQSALKQNDNTYTDDSNSVYPGKTSEQYITTVISEFDQSTYQARNNPKQDDVVACIDPEVANSNPYNNKSLILKNIFISNLRATPKVSLFKNNKKSEEELPISIKNENTSNQNHKKPKKNKDFNICTALIKEKLKTLSQDKADKARKFAYSLFSKKLAKGYAASLDKHELAKQFIHHAATWKPTKIWCSSRDQQIDTALSVAWKAVIKGIWQAPLEWNKAQALQHEYIDYRNKYLESGILSQELRSLESTVKNVLGIAHSNLSGKITDWATTTVPTVKVTETKESYFDEMIGTSNNNKLHDNLVSIAIPKYIEDNHSTLLPKRALPHNSMIDNTEEICTNDIKLEPFITNDFKKISFTLTNIITNLRKT